MVRAWIEQLLGAWGTSLLDFYAANSLYINLLVVAYGGVVVLSWMNLKAIRQRLLADLVDQLSRDPRLGEDARPKKVLSRMTIPYDQAIQQARFPFVAQQTSFLPRRATLAAVQALLPAEELADDALKALAKTGNRTTKSQSSQRKLR
jgi:hypothetical protein